MRIHQTYEKLTFARVRVIALLADGKTIREVGSAIGCTYNGARSQVREIERILECASVAEVRGYWEKHGDAWPAYCARCGGLDRVG
jgi:hypothetical protein